MKNRQKVRSETGHNYTKWWSFTENSKIMLTTGTPNFRLIQIRQFWWMFHFFMWEKKNRTRDFPDSEREKTKQNPALFSKNQGWRESKRTFPSQGSINQQVMKVSFPTGRRQKEHLAGPRAHAATLHPLPAPAGIFMRREEQTSLREKRNHHFGFHMQHMSYDHGTVRSAAAGERGTM